MPGEFDINAAADQLGAELGFGESEADDDLDLGTDDTADRDPAGGDTDPAAAGNVGDKPAPTAAAPAPAPGTTDPTAKPPAGVPDTWRAEAKPFWGGLPEQVKAEILKRESDAMEGINQYKADAAQGKLFAQAIAPFKPVMDRYGIDAVAQVNGLMQAHYTLALGTPEEKVGLINKLLADYQITMPAASDEVPFQDPQVAGLQTKIAVLESQLQGFTQQHQQVEMAKAERELDAFMADPANIYAKDLTEDMAKLLRSGMAKDLADAYQQATWRNPVTRQKELTRQQTERDQAAAKAEAERVAAAKAAAAANVRSRAKDGRSAVPLGSMDDTLKETLAKIQAKG